MRRCVVGVVARGFAVVRGGEVVVCGGVVSIVVRGFTVVDGGDEVVVCGCVVTVIGADAVSSSGSITPAATSTKNTMNAVLPI